MLLERGATSVLAAVSQALLTPEACRRLDDSPITRLYVTDAVPLLGESDKVEVVSVAGLFGEAIRRIAQRESISVLFE